VSPANAVSPVNARDEFAAALRAMLGAAGGPAVARQWADGNPAPGLALWRRLAGLGVTGLAVPEKRGGLGASPAYLVAACVELGQHALPGPVAESLAAVPTLLATLDETGSLADTGRAWLVALAAGDLIATLAMPPWLPLAADAEIAGLTLLADGDVVWAGRAGARRRSVDPTRSLSAVAGHELIARTAGAAVARAFDLGALACSAQLLGAGHALLERSVRHASVRAQFGQPVGAFQAVKHKLADVAIGLEFARPLLDAAAAAIGDGSATASRDVSAAKVACADAAYRAARAGLQVHGAVGYTAEHDLGLWLTRVRALIPAWGGQAEHRERVVAALAARSREELPWT
jgi:alkylation response protein AidB-like acyl-CoA dehydrogenase